MRTAELPQNLREQMNSNTLIHRCPIWVCIENENDNEILNWYWLMGSKFYNIRSCRWTWRGLRRSQQYALFKRFGPITGSPSLPPSHESLSNRLIILSVITQSGFVSNRKWNRANLFPTRRAAEEENTILGSQEQAIIFEKHFSLRIIVKFEFRHNLFMQRWWWIVSPMRAGTR